MNWKIQKAANCISEGGILAYPTEGVWGLGCDPENDRSIKRLLLLKQRPWQKGLILIADKSDYFEPLLSGLEPAARLTILNSWPGPVTWIVPDTGVYSELVRGVHNSVAIRVTDHPLVVRLTRRLGFPIISTSANPATCQPAKTQLRARCYFGSQVDFYLPGPLGNRNQPSQIRDATTGNVLRA